MGQSQNCLASLDDVWSVLVDTLAIDDRPATIDAQTPLLGAQPELDSMGVLALLFALEERFGIEVEDDEVQVDMFETLGSLTEFVGAKMA